MTELSLFGGAPSNFDAESGVIHYPETGQSLRWIKIDGIPWFHFGDLCKGAGHKNPSAAIHIVEDDDKRKIDVRSLSAGQTALTNLRAAVTGNAETWFVNEDGFATLGLAGRGDGPRNFRRWVVKVVIPAFRNLRAQLSRKDLALMVVAAEEEREQAIAERNAVRLELAAAGPKIKVYDEWFDPHNAVEPTDFAKRIGLRSAQELNGHLRNLGIMRRDRHPRTGQMRNLPTADWGHCFRVLPQRIPTGDFVDVAWILPQGQLEIVEELRNAGILGDF